MDGAPFEVLETHFLRMQQRKAVVQTKIRNLITGKILDRNFQASDFFEEAEIERKNAIFIYESKGQYWFHDEGNPKNRFVLEADLLGEQGKFLKPDTKVATMVFDDKVIKADIPIKMEFKVIGSPSGDPRQYVAGRHQDRDDRGRRKVNVPLFVNEGETIRINTQTGEYVERV